MSRFAGVVTTGIYCRPECSGNPLPGNVRRFDCAAAAEAAGFRACMRCRPYRGGDVFRLAEPEIVCRGIHMILDGALDNRTEPHLAGRLGVSSRHMRRLFQTHVGVTPDQLARSSRAHFARRLLDDTDLSVTDIAFAAGFGSVRQFNRSMLDIFRATPLELRARRRKHDRLVADGGLLLRLSFSGPLDWESMLASLRREAIPGVEHVDSCVYRRTILVEGDLGALEIRQGQPGELLMLAHLPHWRDLINVVRRARRLFNLDVDLETANRTLCDDPMLGPLVDTRPGLRVPGTWDPFEVAVRAVIGECRDEGRVAAVMQQLVERHGRPAPGLAALGLTHLFPTPSTLAAAGLDGTGLDEREAGIVRSLALVVTDGTLALDRSMRLQHLVNTLIVRSGMAASTAQYIALRMGESDAFPDDDAELQRALERLTGRRCGARNALELAERWRPWRANATVRLWSLADGPQVAMRATAITAVAAPSA